MGHRSLLTTWLKGAPASSGTGFRHDLEDGLVHAHCIRARPVNLVGLWASSPRPIAWIHSCWPGWRRYRDHPCVPCRVPTFGPCARSWGCGSRSWPCVHRRKSRLDGASPGHAAAHPGPSGAAAGRTEDPRPGNPRPRAGPRGLADPGRAAGTGVVSTGARSPRWSVWPP